MTSRSNAYITTLDPTSTDDMAILSKIRGRVTTANKTGGFQQRVVVRGRKPITKKNYYDSFGNIVATLGYGFGGNIVGGLANAKALDVYIYQR
jgi:hypothetical protein